MLSPERKFIVLNLNIHEKLASGIEVRKLDPETEWKIAGQLDAMWQGAIKPNDTHHTGEDQLMSPDELKEWVTDRSTDMLRAVYKQGMLIGGVYLYNHEPKSKKDPNYQRRAAKLRQLQGVPEDFPVWEMNFFFSEETTDLQAVEAVNAVLTEFVVTHPGQRTMFMAADDTDMRASWADFVGKPEAVFHNWNKRRLAEAEANFQDVRVLYALGFQFVDRLVYAAGEPKDCFYAATIGSASLPHTQA